MNQFSPSFLCLDAWTDHAIARDVTRYPATGTVDLREWSYIGGPIGLNPEGPASVGVATFFWTSDPEGAHIVGVQGMHLSSLIVSLAELRLLNRGPYLYLTYEPWSGPNGLAANLFGTTVGGSQPYLIGDTILIDEQDRTLAAGSTETWYPCDYFAGDAQFYLEAPAGVRATVHGADLTNQFWLLDSTGPGGKRTIVPMGTWLVVVHNPTPFAVPYTVSVTPCVG